MEFDDDEVFEDPKEDEGEEEDGEGDEKLEEGEIANGGLEDGLEGLEDLVHVWFEFFWLPGQDSNLRVEDSKSSALPLGDRAFSLEGFSQKMLFWSIQHSDFFDVFFQDLFKN